MDLGNEVIGRRFGDEGRLEVLRVLGEGASGIVCLAKDHRRERPVALKFLHPEGFFDRRLIRRFRNEGRIFTRLRHPNLVRVFGFGREQGLLYVASEFVLGETLLAMLRRGEAPGFERCLQIARAIADGLHYAHTAGVVHRDLKPENVMVRLHDERVKVLDFGIAKDTSATTDITRGDFVGTPGYSAPEQHAGGPIDARADVFSLGVLLFELTAGRFLSHEGPADSRPITEELPLRSTSLGGELYARFADLIRAMTRLDPRLRTASMARAGEEMETLESWFRSLPETERSAAVEQLRTRLRASSWPLPERPSC